MAMRNFTISDQARLDTAESRVVELENELLRWQELAHAKAVVIGKVIHALEEELHD